MEGENDFSKPTRVPKSLKGKSRGLSPYLHHTHTHTPKPYPPWHPISFEILKNPRKTREAAWLSFHTTEKTRKEFFSDEDSPKRAGRLIKGRFELIWGVGVGEAHPFDAAYRGLLICCCLVLQVPFWKSFEVSLSGFVGVSDFPPFIHASSLPCSLSPKRAVEFKTVSPQFLPICPFEGGGEDLDFFYFVDFFSCWKSVRGFPARNSLTRGSFQNEISGPYFQNLKSRFLKMILIFFPGGFFLTLSIFFKAPKQENTSPFR